MGRAGGTIVARASGEGHSARAIVRMSGPEAFAAIESLVAGAQGVERRSAGTPPPLRVRGAHPVRMRLPVCGQPCECPAMALVMPAPRSFTGEDCVELLVPGNPALVDALVGALLQVPGVAAAAPGAFMARAHAAGRIGLADAERIALEIGATHARDLEAARHVQDNPLVQAAQRASADLAEVLARVEAGIDFTDSEDVVAIACDELRCRVAAVDEELARWVAGSEPLESVQPTPVVALRGAPNAGKSSLFNALLGRTRAVASPAAGTTRDAIVEEIEFRSAPARALEPGVRAMLVDTPGIEDPRSAIDALMQEQGRAADRADVILLCEPLASLMADAPEHAQGRVARAAAGPWRPGACHAQAPQVIHVATRSDEVRSRTQGPATGVLCTSAVTGEGIEALAASVVAALACGAGGTGSSHRIGVLARHRHAMAQAREWLLQCMDAVGSGAGPAISRPELVADALRGALNALGEVTGEVTPDDVLGLVFSRFCIGK